MAKRKRIPKTKLTQTIERTYLNEYRTIELNPTKYIESSIDTFEKCELLDTLLAYFLDKEEYERCAKIRDWIIEVKKLK